MKPQCWINLRHRNKYGVNDIIDDTFVSDYPSIKEKNCRIVTSKTY